MPNAIGFSELMGGSGGTQHCMSLDGVGWDEGVYEVVVHGDLVLSVFGNPYPIGDYPLELTIEVLPNPNGIPGCTYSNAANYLGYATHDDGSCQFLGCTDDSADNYQPLATVDDGSCLTEPCTSVCPSDLDGDGAVGTGDLLSLLSNFGFLCN